MGRGTTPLTHSLCTILPIFLTALVSSPQTAILEHRHLTESAGSKSFPGTICLEGHQFSAYIL